jgi:TetR/AcrR family transcriptional regulator, regulator of mycofactocin system
MAQSLSQTIRTRHAEQMVLEIESVALGLFEVRGFGEVTVDEIAAEAGISPRTFYRHFASKEDVIQVRIDQSANALRAALAERPLDEAPVRSLRRAFVEVISAEDLELRRRWMMLVMSSSALVRAALGGHELKLYPAMAEFFGARLGVPSEDLVPVMLAAAAGGVLRAASTQWLFEGGSLAARIDEALEVLEMMVEARDLAGPF